MTTTAAESSKPAKPLSRREQAGWVRLITPGLRAACEALFPANGRGAPDWQQTQMVERSVALFGELPRRQRQLVILLFVAVRFAPWFLLTGWLPFTRMSVAKRTEQIRRWRSSSLFLRRAIGDGLKATLTMVYLSHPAPLRYMGLATACDNPDDPMDLDVIPHALLGS